MEKKKLAENLWLRELSALEAWSALGETKALFDEFTEEPERTVFLRGMCRYASVLRYALCNEEGKLIYETGKEVLERLSLRQLAFWGKAYEETFPEPVTEEAFLGLEE